MARSLKQTIKRFEERHDMSDQYVAQLRYASRRYQRFLGRKATTKDLKAKKINKWLKHEQDAGELADRTRANLRKLILHIWRSTGAKVDPAKIRKVKVRPKNPEAWSFDEFRLVTEAMATLPGTMPNGIGRGRLMATMFWFAYETGLRRRDVWNFDCFALDDTNQAAITQHKVRSVHVVKLTKRTADDVRSIAEELRECGDGQWNRPLRWTQAERQFYYWVRRAREIAGVDPDTVNRVLQHTRRTGATAVELQGGKPWQFLGHARPGLDRESYVDGVKTKVPTLPAQNREST